MTDTAPSISTGINPVEIVIGKVYYGRCKWFNSKNGYGFISFKNDNGNMNDVFIHHNSIKVNDEQYKYLMIGEYLQFKIVENNNANEQHKYYASEVCGIDGGKLMCETRKEFRDTRNKFKTTKKNDEIPKSEKNEKNETVEVGDSSWSSVVKSKKKGKVA